MIQLGKKSHLRRSILGAMLFVSLGILFFSRDSAEELAPASLILAPILEEKVVSTASEKTLPEEAPRALVNGKSVILEVMRTQKELNKGLSGKPSLGEDEGMLFIFPKAGIYKFWMPDMNFPIDMIWIENGVIVGMHENVSNEFDPKNPKFYTAKTPAKYVLEVNAGWSKENGLEVGDKVEFENI